MKRRHDKTPEMNTEQIKQLNERLTHPPDIDRFPVRMQKSLKAQAIRRAKQRKLRSLNAYINHLVAVDLIHWDLEKKRSKS